MGKDESLYEIGRDIQVHRNKEIREFIRKRLRVYTIVVFSFIRTFAP